MRERFEAILSPDRVIDHPLERRLYSRDGSIAMGDAGLVVLPETTAEVVDCVRLAGELGVPVVPRGSGTGLCRRRRPPRRGDRAVRGADDPHPRRRPAVPCARVEPGVLNLDLSRGGPAPGPALRAGSLEPAGMLDRRQRRDQRRRAPLPRLRRHRAHVLRVEVVLRRRRGAPPRRPRPEPAGYDLRGAFVGGEGMLGIATRICVRLTRDPPARAHDAARLRRRDDGAADGERRSSPPGWCRPRWR